MAGGDEVGLRGERVKRGFAPQFEAAAAPKSREGWSLLSMPLWRANRDAVPTGFASQGDSLNKAKVTQLLVDHPAVITANSVVLLFSSFALQDTQLASPLSWWSF